MFRIDLPYRESDRVSNIADNLPARDFCRRFNAWSVPAWQEACNETRLDGRRQQDDSFLDEA